MNRTRLPAPPIVSAIRSPVKVLPVPHAMISLPVCLFQPFSYVFQRLALVVFERLLRGEADIARRGRQPSKPKPQSAPIGPDGPKHPDNRQLYDKRGCPDAGARYALIILNPKWQHFTLSLTVYFEIWVGLH